MDYFFAERIVHLVDELGRSNDKRFVSPERTYARVITDVRLLKQWLTTKELTDILEIFEQILQQSKQVKKADGNFLGYVSGNMVGKRAFDKEFRELFSKEFDLATMKLFVKKYIQDLQVAENEGEKKDIEFSLRNLEVFLDSYCSFQEDSTVTKQLVLILERTIENR